MSRLSSGLETGPDAPVSVCSSRSREREFVEIMDSSGLKTEPPSPVRRLYHTRTRLQQFEPFCTSHGNPHALVISGVPSRVIQQGRRVSAGSTLVQPIPRDGYKLPRISAALALTHSSTGEKNRHTSQRLDTLRTPVDIRKDRQLWSIVSSRAAQASSS